MLMIMAKRKAVSLQSIMFLVSTPRILILLNRVWSLLVRILENCVPVFMLNNFNEIISRLHQIGDLNLCTNSMSVSVKGIFSILSNGKTEWKNVEIGLFKMAIFSQDLDMCSVLIEEF